MPRNYKWPQAPRDMYGEANAYTISLVGRDKLDKAFLNLKLPLHAQWTHLKTDIEELWGDGSLKAGVAYFSGKIRTMQNTTTAEIVIPLSIRNGVILDPAIFQYANKTDVFTKEAITDLFEGVNFPKPVLDRAYIYAPPPEPGTFVPIQPSDQSQFDSTKK